jgi:hypothetical protein
MFLIIDLLKLASSLVLPYIVLHILEEPLDFEEDPASSYYTVRNPHNN